ncbi:hypothetical protein [Streptomyces sp. ISL-100]|uniref:hypothetical protein n=1 Tax=Streptomyces sp. ISL-100 TaxID=2819173 RepID=UPI001BE9FC59|nr:hypothetical protein [Streptomyces sp. ISL-100]MBT2401672.1 hypothetical protein [Streptomyces sp. ISL-100]
MASINDLPGLDPEHHDAPRGSAAAPHRPAGLRATWTPQLTEHEIVILRLLARGRTHVEVAALLKVRPETAGPATRPGTRAGG